MLKNSIVKNFNIQKKDEDYMSFNFRGELDIKGHRNGELVYHDGGDNTITLWAKHSLIHILTGDSFTTFGASAINSPNVTSASQHSSSGYTNVDGMLISQKQFWWDYDNYATLCPNYSVPNPSDTTSPLYSLQPSKVLFGTGIESTSWDNLTTLQQSTLTSAGYTSATFNGNGTSTGISDPTNIYSATNTNGTYTGNYLMAKTRSFNDPLSAKISGTPDSSEFGIQGAIKDGVPGSGSPSLTIPLINQGIGRPCFIYLQKDFSNRWTTSSSEMYLSMNAGDAYEHKITYTITMPDQTDSNSGWYYPYNGYTLKVVGLFANSRLAVANSTPATTSDPAYYPYNNMQHGIMFAKRYISPITKTADLSLTLQWTLYL